MTGDADAELGHRDESPDDHDGPEQIGGGAHAAPADAGVPTPAVDRGFLILEGLKGLAAWSWRFLLVVAALYVLFMLVGEIWVGVLPLALALILCTVLWPPVRQLRAWRVPPALAAALVLLVVVAIFAGIVWSVSPAVADQVQTVVDQAATGLDQVRTWLTGPPFNLANSRLDELLSQGSEWLSKKSTTITDSVLSGVSAVGSFAVTFAMVVVLTFFFLKDGTAFLPWLRRVLGPTAGLHVTEALARVWLALGGFVRAQAIVAFMDALFIGLGLLLLHVPLAVVLALITFIGAFIPIVGSVIAGSLAVLVALVSQGLGTAVWVLVIVVVVQQVEGNVLHPVLQSRAVDLHAGVILVAVAAAGTRWGIMGAFLAVPAVASAAALLRYLGEHLDLRTGELAVADLHPRTGEGVVVAQRAEESAPLFARRAQESVRRAEEELDQARASAGSARRRLDVARRNVTDSVRRRRG